MDTNLERLTEIFNKMQADGWNIQSNLNWGFFFVDPDKEKLKRVYEELKDNNYVLEDIYQPDDEEFWTLHVSKIETLTSEKLHKRNIAFNELADYCEVESYDGWDVEKIKA